MARTNKKSFADDALNMMQDGEEAQENSGKSNEEQYISDIKPGPGRMSRELASFWLAQCQGYETDRGEFVKRGNNVIRRFRDDRNKASEDARRMNMLWAHIKIMMPAVYSKKPVPIVDRKFLDHDVVGRLSSQIAERALRNEININNYHPAVKAAVLDHLLPGQGVVWIRYESEVADSISLPADMKTGMDDDLYDIQEKGGKAGRNDDKETEQLEATDQQVVSESVPVDYIDWKDFGMLPSKARQWKEVQAVFKRVMISRKEAKERFGDDIGEAMSSTSTPIGEAYARGGRRGDTIFQDQNDRSIVVYEIWNKTDRRVYWVSPGYQYLADVRDDPLQLSEFFPTPKPLWATMSNDTLIPVPDYYEWQDQALQIDELTMRIALLAKACKIAGTYDAQNNALKRIFQESTENELIPVDQWAVYAERGGIAGAISLVPIKDIQSVLETLIKVRKLAMEDLDTVTGVNDIMRGTSDSRETLGGVRLKNNTTGTRLSERQEEVARFARDTIILITEVMCKHFTEDTLVEASGILFDETLSKDVILAEIEAEQAQQAPQQPPMQPPQDGQSNVIPFPGAQSPQPIQAPQGPSANPLIPQKTVQQLLDAKVAEKIQEKIAAAIKLLRSDIPRRYRIDIETDSTVYADAGQEKENAVEFIKSFSDFMKSAEQTVQNMPEAMPLMGKMLQFGVRKFRTGRDLEAAIDVFVDQMTKKAKKLIENPPPSPDEAKAKSEEIKQQGELAKIKASADAQQQNDARAAQIHEQEAASQMQLSQIEAAKEEKAANADLQREMISGQFQAKLDEFKLNMQMRELERQEEFKAKEHTMKMQLLDKQMAAASEKATSKESDNG